MAWSLKGFTKSLQKVTIEINNNQGDFEKWAETSLSDKILAKQLEEVRLSKLKGEKLRKSIVKVAKKRFKATNQKTRAGYFKMFHPRIIPSTSFP